MRKIWIAPFAFIAAFGMVVKIGIGSTAFVGVTANQQTVNPAHFEVRDCEVQELLASYPEVDPTFDTVTYWETRYANGGNSGEGSDGRIAEYKGRIVNEVCTAFGVQTVLEFGVGDGKNQEYYNKVPVYIGVDASESTIKNVQAKFGSPTRTYFLYDTFASLPGRADMTMSLDVLYHLVEAKLFGRYLDNLFAAAISHVLIFAADIDDDVSQGGHFRRRKFTRYVELAHPCYYLERHFEDIPDNVAERTSARFYHYRRRQNCFESRTKCKEQSRGFRQNY